jgi:glucosamine--fructose-6-phosphate aminotransferase (isomerizing)
VNPILSPVPLTVMVQLIAYYTAKKRGRPIDKPRNLAKSVTVD